jgi:hypothetical protein
MGKLPNQISSARIDLLVKIARCKRLAKEVTDQPTVQRLLALAAEYEQQI